jgi:hypothetical protein
VEQDREEDHEPELHVEDEPGRDRDAVEECVDGEGADRSHGHVAVQHLLMVCLLAEVEVRGDRVLEELDDEVPGEEEDHHPLGVARRELETARQDLEKDRREHESRPEGDEKPQSALIQAFPGGDP